MPAKSQAAHCLHIIMVNQLPPTALVHAYIPHEPRLPEHDPVSHSARSRLETSGAHFEAQYP